MTEKSKAVKEKKQDYKKYDMTELEKGTKNAVLSAINGFNVALNALKGTTKISSFHHCVLRGNTLILCYFRVQG